MTIDEAIERLKGYVNDEARLGYVEFAEFYSQIIKWLEELKWIKETRLFTKAQLKLHKECAYNKAIDDISSMIKDWCYEEVPTDILLQRLTEIKEWKRIEID